ncbi:hypothetical protein C5167_050933 [Papaver somniferum]|uniref:Uncharacterized protein n=1 Tax=Papaver somniferum TaxID=3469 RepID=A0A4Y7KTJ8_PAPSO|nr:hypothetical protein C5167_050933 [Papaver somniferum]
MGRKDFSLFKAEMDFFLLDECYKKVSLSIARGILRNKKAKWKRDHYIPLDTNEKCLADRPNALTDWKWKDLVKLWSAEGYQVLSNRNMKSRGHQKAKHIMGRISFRGRKAEMVNVKERIQYCWYIQHRDSFISSGITYTSKCP